MGFGWMFLGYMLLLGTNFEILGITVDITPDVLGFLLASHGFTVANKYCDCFRATGILAKIGIPLSVLYLFAQIAISAELITLSAVMLAVIRYGYAIFKLAFTLSLLYSLNLISTQTGVEKLRKKSIRLAIYTVLFFFAEHSLATIFSWFGLTLDATKLAAGEMLLNALCVVINATLIFGCYMWICLEGDEDMPDNRTHKYKTPFDYFENRNKRDAEERAQKQKQKQKKH